MRERKHQYITGDPWLICDECGLKYRRSEMLKRWDGFMVCRNDHEPRHPQEFMRARRDKIVFDNPRPDYDQQLGGENLLDLFVSAGGELFYDPNGLPFVAPNEISTGEFVTNDDRSYTLDGNQTSDVSISWRVSGRVGMVYRTTVSVTGYQGNGTANFALQKNLVTNGTFKSSVDGWTGINTDLSLSSEKLRATLTADYVGVAYQELATVAGTDYLLDFSSCNGDSGIYSATVRVRKDHPEYGSSLYTYPGSAISSTIKGATFTAASSSTFICLRNTASTTGMYTEWDNISVRESGTSNLFESDISWNGNYVHEGELDFSDGFLVFSASEDFVGTIKVEFRRVFSENNIFVAADSKKFIDPLGDVLFAP